MDGDNLRGRGGWVWQVGDQEENEEDRNRTKNIHLRQSLLFIHWNEWVQPSHCRFSVAAINRGVRNENRRWLCFAFFWSLQIYWTNISIFCNCSLFCRIARLPHEGGRPSIFFHQQESLIIDMVYAIRLRDGLLKAMQTLEGSDRVLWRKRFCMKQVYWVGCLLSATQKGSESNNFNMSK